MKLLKNKIQTAQIKKSPELCEWDGCASRDVGSGQEVSLYCLFFLRKHDGEREEESQRLRQ